jgi:hypothetical protein
MAKFVNSQARRDARDKARAEFERIADEGRNAGADTEKYLRKVREAERFVKDFRRQWG